MFKLRHFENLTNVAKEGKFYKKQTKENMIENQVIIEDEKVMSKDDIGYLKRELHLVDEEIYFNKKDGSPDYDGGTFCKECVDEGRGKQSTVYSEEKQQYECTNCVAFVRTKRIKEQVHFLWGK